MKILDNIGTAIDNLSQKGSKWTSILVSFILFYLALRNFGSNILSNSLGITGRGYQLLPYSNVDLSFMLFDPSKTLTVEGQAFLIAALISMSQMVIPPLIRHEMKSTGGKWCPPIQDGQTAREIPFLFVIVYMLMPSTKNKTANHVRSKANSMAIFYALIWMLMAYMDVYATVSYQIRLVSAGGISTVGQANMDLLWSSIITTVALNIFLAEMLLLMSFAVIIASAGEMWEKVTSIKFPQFSKAAPSKIKEPVPPQAQRPAQGSGGGGSTRPAQQFGGGGLGARDSLGTPARSIPRGQGEDDDPLSIFSSRRAD